MWKEEVTTLDPCLEPIHKSSGRITEEINKNREDVKWKEQTNGKNKKCEK